MSDDMKLTKAQAEALRKWVEYGSPAHPKLLGVNGGVYDRLLAKEYLAACGFLVRFPSDKGLAALAAYDERNVKGKPK